MSVARFIADQRTNYRVPHTICCGLLGVSLAWFYKWWQRALRGGPHTSQGEAARRGRHRGGGGVRHGAGTARLTAAGARSAGCRLDHLGQDRGRLDAPATAGG